jgi:kumamolisin
MPDFHVLPDSQRGPVEVLEQLGAIDSTEDITITLILRRRAPVPEDLVFGPRTMQREEFAATYGADPADLARVRDSLGLPIVAEDLASRRVQVRGSAAELSAAFGVTLTLVASRHPGSGDRVEHRYRTGTLQVPAELGEVVTAVIGLDDRPQARAQSRIAAPGSVTTSYTPVQLGTIYDFPAGVDGTGQTLAIIELGGGFAQSDLDSYFGGLGITGPTVRAQSVDGAKNTPGQDPSGADGEVLLDIEVAGALAPKAEQVVYFGPNTDQGFIDAISTAVHATPTPAALSISWGQSEDSWSAQSRTAMDQAFTDAAALGVTVCVAAGDGGSSDGATDGKAHADFPASSPHVLGCGGTSLQASGATVQSETVWNSGSSGGATGGGVSDVFDQPAWQANAGVPARPGGGTGRGVPDVAADADPATGYQVLIDGQQQVIGGTSAAAPLWAALVCRLTQATGRRLGVLQTGLYPAAAGQVAAGFRDVTSGSNGDYSAAAGWDACTGLGVPVGSALLTALKSAPTS